MSYEGEGRTKGQISTETVRAVIAAPGIPEPDDCSDAVLCTTDGMYPADVGHWAPNLRGGGWAAIHAIENGWVRRTEGGCLEITEYGLKRHGILKEAA